MKPTKPSDRKPSSFFQASRTSSNFRKPSALKPKDETQTNPNQNVIQSSRKIVQNESRDAILYATAQGLLKYPVADPKRVKIKLMSSEEIKSMSSVTVTNDDKNPNTLGGINDKRMGTVSRSDRCGTCKQIVCQGHMGMYELPQPIFNPLQSRNILHTMNSVCNQCSALLIDPNSCSDIKKLQGEKGSQQ